MNRYPLGKAGPGGPARTRGSAPPGWRLLLALICFAGTCPAVIVDRIAVAVGNQVITTSALEQETRLTAFLNEAPLEINEQTRRQAASRLTEQKLIKKELEFGRYPLPTMADAEPRVEAIRKRYASPAAYQEALQKYGISETDLKDHLLWQLQLLKFIELRFRPGVQVTDQEIAEYFKTRVLPLEKNAQPEDYRDRIEETLLGQKVDKELNDWLREARGRTRIEVKEDAFR